MSFSEIAARLRGWPRRVLALACLLLAVVTALSARHEKPPVGPDSAVLVAARDLAAGARLSSADVRVQAWPARLRPPAAQSRPAQVVGRRLAGPIRAGEAITGTRLAGSGLTAGLPPTLQAVPIQVTGAASLSLVHVGDSIDLLAGDSVPGDVPASRPARVLAQRVRVLAVAEPLPDTSIDGTDGSLGLIVAVDRATALRIAAAAGRPVVATVRSPS